MIVLAAWIAVLGLYPQAETTPGDAEREFEFNVVFDSAFFKKADVNEDGVISLSEFQIEIGKRIDSEIGSDSVSRAKMTAEKKSQIMSEIVNPLFHKLDKNNDGFLQYSEGENNT